MLPDIAAWRQTAGAWVLAAERAASTTEQQEWAAAMRARYEFLRGDVPMPWNMAQRVRDYVLIAQQTSCALQGIGWGTGPGSREPEVVEPEVVEPEVVEPEVVEPEVVEPEVVEPEVVEPKPEPDDNGGFSFPSLPGFPGFPSLPKWPFSWPSLPWWFWPLVVVVVLWWLLSDDEGERRRRR